MTQSHLLAEQYLDASNLGTRGEFNERFTVSETHPHRWVFEHVDAPPGARVLDLGCGHGAFWAANADRATDRDWNPTLADFSPGMLADARDGLSDTTFEPDYAVADGGHLPFQRDTFDVALALMMLYHLPDIESAIEDLRRALAPDGKLYASVGADGNAGRLFELMETVADGTVEPLEGGFTGGNGAALLEPAFESVGRHVLEDTVRVDDPDALVAYVLSMPLEDPRLSAFDPADADALRERVADRIAADGAITWQKDTVLFVAEG